jgi:phospholipid-binding lipoprotein MlaA
MKPYGLILFLLIAAAGCNSSAKKSPDSLPASPPEVDLSADADFDLFEEELTQKQLAVSDPLESFNRTMFGFNDIFYFWIAKPVVQTYENTVPKPARVGIGNFFENLTTPARFVNCLLQGKGDLAGRELHRFGINTTAGVLGFGAPALDRYGLEPAKEDLGQTLAVHGLGDGFYLVWPLFGPSTLRDSVGAAGDAFLNPVRYVKPTEASIGISVTDAVNEGSFHTGEYEAFKAAAIDPYIAMRTAYIQYRKQLILNRSADPDPFGPQNIVAPSKVAEYTPPRISTADNQTVEAIK